MVVLDKNFRIENDSFEYTLIKEQDTGRVNEKTGKKIISTDHWHFPNLKLSLKKYVNESLKVCDGVEEILTKLNELNEKIDKISNCGSGNGNCKCSG